MGAGVRSSWRRAVVADDDRVDAVLDGDRGVLGGQDALEHERQRRPAADRREVVPGQPDLGLALEHGDPAGVDAEPRASAVASAKLPRPVSSKPERRSRSR